jgi:hypothetical protein
MVLWKGPSLCFLLKALLHYARPFSSSLFFLSLRRPLRPLIGFDKSLTAVDMRKTPEKNARPAIAQTPRRPVDL